MTTETETEIVKQYLKGLAPDELVAFHRGSPTTAR